MKFASHLFLRLRWINLPGAMLVALLQRTPVARLAVAAEEMVAVSPVGTLLRSVFTAAASLGAVHALAGATQFQTSKSSPVSGTVGTSLSYAFSVTGAATPAGSYRLTGTLPPGMTLLGANANGVINATSGTISGTPTTAGTFNVAITAYEFNNAQGDPFGPLNVRFVIAGAAATAPAITSQPAAQTADANSAVTLSVAASGSPTPTVQWQRNGVDVSGATSTTLSLSSLQPGDAGIYRAIVTNSAGTATSDAVIVGLRANDKVTGAGSEIGSDIKHPNGNFYDQVLLTGTAAAIKADPGQITRLSYIDLTDDIVQVEFAGNGTLTISLDNASGPAAPVNYNQAVNYMKGNATITIADADESTNVSVFSVGHATAFDPTGAYNPLQPFSDTNNPANNGNPIFQGHPVGSYDGVADIAVIAIASTNGKFGGVRTANTSYLGTHGLVGVYAPGVTFTGPVFLSDISADGDASPVIQLGAAADTRVTGGDLSQLNGRPVQVSGLSQLKFVDGIKSSGTLLPAQMNQGVLMQNGTNVTNQVVVNPGN